MKFVLNLTYNLTNEEEVAEKELVDAYIELMRALKSEDIAALKEAGVLSFFETISDSEYTYALSYEMEGDSGLRELIANFGGLN